MKVAMVSEHASPLAALGGVDSGGQNVHVAELARALARRGVQVDVHTRRDDPALPEWIEVAPGVRIHHVDAGPAAVIPKDDLRDHMPEFEMVLRRAWLSDRPDVVHAHFWMSGIAALGAARSLDLPVVQTFHALGVVKRRYQGDRDTSPPGRLDDERRLVRDMDQILATCSDEAFELMRLGADRRRLSIVPCGVDLDGFHPADAPAPRGRPQLLTVGRLVERKGVGNAISALAGVPDADLLVVGGPAAPDLEADPDVARLRELAEACGVADRVRFAGRLGRDDVAAAMRAADLVLCTPWYEPFGIVPLEAMASGTPVVATAVGGMVDTVVDGVTGRLVPPRDPARLGEVITELLADPAERERMGRAAVDRTRRLYGWDRVGRLTLEVLTTVAERHRSSTAAPPAPARHRQHLDALGEALRRSAPAMRRAELLGERLGERLAGGGRLLVAGNGGSAAQAQHLAAELVGRFVHERQPVSAICLHAETSSLTAITNDYGIAAMYARQVTAHGRAGDVLLLVSTSGESENLLHAATAAHAAGVEVWAMTGRAQCSLADVADEVLLCEADGAALIQELQLVATHVLCEAVDEVLHAGGHAEQPATPTRRWSRLAKDRRPGTAEAARIGGARR